MPDCPLCASNATLMDFAVSGGPTDASTQICATCADQINTTPDPQHWRGLAASMWSDDVAIQVISARMLTRLSDHPWARDLADTLYLDDETRAWADNAPSTIIHRDSNGAVLAQGDTVTLIKDLPVKGAGFTAKRGTAVRSISLVQDNADHIEGRVDGQKIVILTEFVKKR